jgi:hypothetical protein
MFNPEDLAYRETPKKRFRFRIRLPRFSPHSFKNPKVYVPTILLFGVMLGAGGLIGYQMYKTAVPPSVESEMPEDAPPQDVLGLIESVEKKVPDIPKNELPSVATVKDLKSLSDQAFFQGAQVGDRIMIYSVSKRAILFRPSTNEIVRQGPVEIVGENQDENASSSAVLSASDSAQPALRIKY